MHACFPIKTAIFNLQNKARRQKGRKTQKSSHHKIMKPSETSSSCSSSSVQTSSPTGTIAIPEPKYKGVRKRKWGKWVSEIRLPNSRERIWLGSYDSVEKAARAFDAALYCLRGRGAKFNFPDNPPEIEGGETLGPQEIQVVAARYANEEPRRGETPFLTRGIMEQNASLSSDGGGLQIERSSNEQGGAIDWSFLNMLESGSDFGLHNIHTDDHYYPPPPPPMLLPQSPQIIDPPPPPLLPQSPQIIDGNVRGDSSNPHDDQGYSEQFLWNF